MTILPVPFYFIRHGETDWNRTGRVMGQQDIPLNSHGIEQAHQAARYLQNVEIARIISSPLSRALKTAEIINSYLNVPLGVYEDLKECARGKEEGLFKTDLGCRREWLNRAEAQEGESAEVFQERIIRTINQVIRSDQKVLIVAHAGIFDILLQALQSSGEQTGNCIPYLFEPPYKKMKAWSVCNLTECSLA